MIKKLDEKEFNVTINGVEIYVEVTADVLIDRIEVDSNNPEFDGCYEYPTLIRNSSIKINGLSKENYESTFFQTVVDRIEELIKDKAHELYEAPLYKVFSFLDELKAEHDRIESKIKEIL